VAITVLTVAIVGPLYAVHRSVAASYTARDTLVATALAQEAMEFVRIQRDDNYLSNNANWMNGLSACIVTGAEGPSDFGCGVDPVWGAYVACPSTGCAPLTLDAGSVIYHQGGAYPATRFRRKITITSISATEVEVKVVVSWSTLRIPYAVTVTESP
jgi:hypothetical protein